MFIQHIRQQQANELANRGYAYFASRTDEQIAKALRISVKVVSLARSIAYDHMHNQSSGAYRNGFNGSKS